MDRFGAYTRPSTEVTMEMSTLTLVGMSIFTAAASAFAAIDTRGAIIHYKTEPWTNHAMFHAVTGLFYTQALCVLIIILIWIPFRQGHMWSWWTTMFIAVAIHGGHLVGDLMTEGGLRGGGTAQGPGIIFYSLTVAALVAYFVGLALTYGHVRGNSAR